MPKYSAKFFFKHDLTELIRLTEKCLEIMDFPPKLMTIYGYEKNEAKDIPYERSILLKSIKNRATSITIQNQEYDSSLSETLVWFRITIDQSYFFNWSFEWNNISLPFLNEHTLFDNLIKSPKFICGYYYDYIDVFWQSNKMLIYLSNQERESESLKTTKNQFGDIILDTSNNWGRSENAAGIDFMAAPLMWFGSGFFDVISFEKLGMFEKSEKVGENIIFIKLFNIEEDPNSIENRLLQKKFWEYFSLVKQIEDYRNKNQIDLSQWLKIKAASKRK